MNTLDLLFLFGHVLGMICTSIGFIIKYYKHILNSEFDELFLDCISAVFIILVWELFVVGVLVCVPVYLIFKLLVHSVKLFAILINKIAQLKSSSNPITTDSAILLEAKNYRQPSKIVCSSCNKTLS